MTILSVKNLSLTQPTKTLFKNATFSLNATNKMAVIGPNGCGKTTLLKTISGIMDPEKGTISLMGENIQGIEPDKIVKKGITHVPEGREVFPILTVEENLKMGAFSRTDRENILVDLNLVYDYFPILRSCKLQQAGTLSGGQQQMMAIGRGLMARPKVMLLDEPSLGLSPLLTKDIFKIIKRLNVEQGVTMILVEQNAKVALNIANYGYVMELGRIVMSDDSSKLVNSKDIQEFYLGQNNEFSERGQKRWKQRKTWR